jgi:hypothetical protein
MRFDPDEARGPRMTGYDIEREISRDRLRRARRWRRRKRMLGLRRALGRWGMRGVRPRGRP